MLLEVGLPCAPVVAVLALEGLDTGVPAHVGLEARLGGCRVLAQGALVRENAEVLVHVCVQMHLLYSTVIADVAAIRPVVRVNVDMRTERVLVARLVVAEVALVHGAGKVACVTLALLPVLSHVQEHLGLVDAAVRAERTLRR